MLLKRQIFVSDKTSPGHYTYLLKNQIMKNTTELNGSWHELKGKLKQKFAILTDSDVLLIEGKQDEMLGRLQTKLGKTKEEVQKIIAAL
jgi:uncharacterized protein YjbJ (UPF0337 family)